MKKSKHILGFSGRTIYSPKHGSWLNIAENELSALTVQCVKGVRFGTKEKLRRVVESWRTHRNAKQKGIDWQFNIDNARIKLKGLYPNINAIALYEFF